MYTSYLQILHLNHRPPTAGTTPLTPNTDDKQLCLGIHPIPLSCEPLALRGLSFKKAISMMFRGCTHSPIHSSPYFG